MKFSDMKYERPDLQKTAKRWEEATARLEKAASAEEQIQIYREQEKLDAEVNTAMTLCSIRSSIDTRDEFYDKEREFCDENAPLLQEKIHAFQTAFLKSPFRAELEKTFGPLLFQNMELEQKAFSPQITALVQKANALETQYQKLTASAKLEFDGKTVTLAQLGPYKQSLDRAVRRAALETEARFFDSHREEFDDLYDQLVQNRTQQAKTLGFESFVPLGYLRQTRNCYTPKEVEAFRQQVAQDLVPVVQDLKKEQAKRLGLKDFAYWDDALFFPDGNAKPQGTPEELLAAAKRMYQELSPQTAEFIEMMFDMELFDVLSKEGKAPGGYCTDLPLYHCPFIFSNFNGTSADVDVLTHEAGHAFASYIADRSIPTSALRQPTMEACETHSMSMEFLTAPWHPLFFGDQTAKYETAHAENALAFLPYGCMVDEFQETVYTQSSLSPEERNRVWLDLEKKYRPYLDFGDLPFYSRGAGWQRQLHIYLYPFYYIDYCLAQTAALQFWMLARRDREEAWKKYLSFVKLGGTKSFLDLLETAGLTSPFEPGCMKRIALLGPAPTGEDAPAGEDARR